MQNQGGSEGDEIQQLSLYFKSGRVGTSAQAKSPRPPTHTHTPRVIYVAPLESFYCEATHNMPACIPALRIMNKNPLVQEN